MPAIWTQSYPPSPHFTEKDLKSQRGKVFVITGGATGIGFQLASMLYSHDGTVYIAGRSREKAEKSIKLLQSCFPSSKGRIRFIYLDLGDLKTIQPAVQQLQSYETQIDVLWNNAGIGADVGSATSTQGIELHYAINCIGPLLFTRLLQKQLEASTGPARVIWTASMTIEMRAPPGGVDLTKLEETKGNGLDLYAGSKAGNWLIASELAKESKVIHLAINPGNLRTPIWRYAPWLLVQILNYTMLYPARNGAYTAMWAGLSEDVTPEDSGKYVIPWGRWHPEPREDILTSLKSEDEGGSGVARKFVEWCESKYSAFEGKPNP